MMERSARKNLPVTIIKKSEDSSDLQFWQKKTPQERIDAVEFLRSQYYSLSGCKTTPRITPVIQFRSHHT
jgi:hypothetical protein